MRRHHSLKQIAIAGMLTCLGASAFATNYFFVQPKSGEMSKGSSLSVRMNPSALPAATVGLPYNNGSGFDLKSVLAVSGDSGFNPALAIFAITAGTLPSGLTVSAEGLISGTPTVTSAGSVVQVTATYKATSGAQTYQVISLNLAVNLAAATLPTGTVGLDYNNGAGFDFATVLSAPADASFNASLATFTLTSGSIPAGMTLSSAGKLTGTPTVASASSSIQVTANYKSASGVQTYQVVSLSLAVTMAPATLPVGTPGSTYNNGVGFDFATVLSAPADASFNASLATFTLTSGNMPEGMSLSTAGKLTGIPTASSAGTMLQVAANYKSNTGTQSYNWIVGGVPDPYFADVVVLLHMEGANGATTFTEAKGLSVSSSGATLTTTNPKFGSSSLAIKGGDQVRVANGGLYLAGDYTSEFWLKSPMTAGSSTYMDNWSASTGGSQFYVINGALRYYYSASAHIASSVVVSPNTWTHLAATRSGTTVRLFVNGTLAGTALNTAKSNGLSTLAVNYQQNAGPTYYGLGTMDEIRITKGVARYTTNFTVPAEAFPSN